MLEFERLYQDLLQMLPEYNSTFIKLKVKGIKLNVNKKSPETEQYHMKQGLASLGMPLYQRLCQLYEKDFVVFGYDQQYP